MLTSIPRNAAQRVGLVAAVCAGLVLGGCPSYKVTGFELVPGSAKPGAFSLGFQLEVTLPESEPDEGPYSLEGRGLIAVWLPEGWKATGMRIKGPGQEAYADLELQPELLPALPVTFPYVPGAWWSFVTDCQEIGEGVHVFELVADASGPTDETKVTAGIAIELFEGEVEASILDSEIAVDLEQTTAIEVLVPGRHGEKVESSLEPCQEPGPEPDEEEEDLCDCPKCPAQVGRGKRGCSCGAVGSPGRSRGLVGLIVSAFS